MQIIDNCIVELSYQLHFKGDDEPVERFSERNPLEILIGLEEMLPEFENLIKGKKAGDKFEFVIPKEKAFGEYNEDLLIELPIERFYDNRGALDTNIIKEGAIISLNTEDESEQDALILEITDTDVLLDLNHPFAGEDLYYSGMILSVRLAD